MTAMRILLFSFAALFAVAGLSSGAWAQSQANATGQAPIGIEEKSDAKGPSLQGVLAVELINSDGFQADSVRAVARLRRGSTLLSFYAELAGPVFFFTDAEKTQFQGDLLAAFRDVVLDEFFDDDCGNTGPNCVLVLKQADEFGLTADEADNQFAVMDVTVALAEPMPMMP